jgi:putative restriction endonuclease
MGVRFWVGITDRNWYEFLSLRRPDEVNFWQPSGSRRFRAIDPGALFLFKLHSPDNYIVGGGFFVRHTTLPARLAWDAFGEKNGVSSMTDFLDRIAKYRRESDLVNPVVGCNILVQPFFFSRENWLPVPRDWAPNIVTGKTYDSDIGEGAALYRLIQDRLLAHESLVAEGIDYASDEPRYGDAFLAHARLGQGTFRALVTDAYNRRCAVTGERTLPTLEAAHIRPYRDSGPHRVANGLLLRSDWHRLLDDGYVTVTPEYRVEVSRRIREEYENGREYYRHHGEPLFTLPEQSWQRPSREFIDWHNAEKFIG